MMTDLTYSDDMATCEPLIRTIWCETHARSLGLSNEGPMGDLMAMQFTAKIHQYRTHYPNYERRIAYINKEPCGYIIWSVDDRELVVVDIAVLNRYQGQGIATAMLTFCIELGESDKKPSRLTVTINNPAISLYEKLGFSIVDSNEVHHEMRRAYSGANS